MKSPSPRKAKKKSSAIADRVNQLSNQAQSRIKVMRGAEVGAGQKALAGSKKNISERSNQKGGMTQDKLRHDYAAGGKKMAGAQAANAYTAYESRTGAEKLGGDPTKGGKLVKASKRKAIRNKNRSKAAIASDKRRFK